MSIIFIYFWKRQKNPKKHQHLIPEWWSDYQLCLKLDLVAKEFGLRRDFEQRAKISTKLTKKGEKEIGEDHGLYQMRFLLDKPITSLTRSQFIQLVNWEQEKQLLKWPLV